MSTTERPPVRQGQAHKRAAILAAARDLFVGTGVDRTSMDAVAARAGVSKRTVYDYYGDKHGLLLGVVEAAGEGAVATLRELVDRHLTAADPAEGPWFFYVTVDLRTGETKFTDDYDEFLTFKNEFLEYCKTSDAC